MKQRKVTGELLNSIPVIRPGNFLVRIFPETCGTDDLSNVCDGVFHAGEDGGRGVPHTRRSPDGELPWNSTPEVSRHRRWTWDMTPSRHSQIRGIQTKRYNKEILKPDTGSVWFFHAGDLNPG
jgi:hypothetical protein